MCNNKNIHVRTFSNESEIRTFARRILDIPKDAHYLNMIYSAMIGVRYNICTFASKKEHKILQIVISNTHFRKNLQLCTFACQPTIYTLQGVCTFQLLL